MPVAEYTDDLKVSLTPADVKDMQDQALCLRDALLIRIGFHIGCRVTELIKIDVPNVHFRSKTITIIVQKKGVHRRCPECGKRLLKGAIRCSFCPWVVDESVIEEENQSKPRFRTVPVDSKTLDMIREYIERGGPKEVIERDKQAQSDVTHLRLFAMTRQTAYKIIRECAERVGITEIVDSESQLKHHVGPHKLRHAFITLALQKNPTFDGARQVQELAGHSDIATTEGYRDIISGEKREVYDRIFEDEEARPVITKVIITDGTKALNAGR